MSGKRYFLAANAIISLLNGNKDLLARLNMASWVGISIISKLEFPSFPAITPKDISLFGKFISKIEIVPHQNENSALIKRIITMRNTKQLKLPDSIIAASALTAHAVLITNDQSFVNIKDLKILEVNC
jgi:predicted nucleic acid-binding protein